MNESQEGIDAFGDFFEQFGPIDIYTIVLFEVLFEELLLTKEKDD